MEHNKNCFRGLFKDKSEEMYLYRPQENKWCLLEIACHLLDEEKEDFRARIKYIFDHPDYDMPSINPPAWVTERNYISRDFQIVVSLFLEEREKSVVWLRDRVHANWEDQINHPKLGVMSAKLFLNNWLAHDYLHMRQILRLHYAFLKDQSGLNLDYAGNW
nr:DinB family protein [Aestuariivivens sediminicola]